MKEFFGSYFHQDWDLDAADSHEVVVAFLTCNKPTCDQLYTLAAGIDRLIESYSESDLPNVLDALGSYYGVTPPETYKSWLTQIAAEFRQAAGGG